MYVLNYELTVSAEFDLHQLELWFPCQNKNKMSNNSNIRYKTIIDYLYKSMSAACKTGYRNKPRGTSFRIDDFSLN